MESKNQFFYLIEFSKNIIIIFIFYLKNITSKHLNLIRCNKYYNE